MSSAEVDDEGDLYELSLIELIIWCILYAIIALMAVAGNFLVIYVTLTKLRTRSITTYFIINLGFADLLTGIFAIPFKFQAALFQEWFLPSSLCQIVPYTETVSLSVSVFTLTASAIHEFRTIFFPKHKRMSSHSARFLVIVIWLIAGIVSLPHGLFHRVYVMEDDTTNLTISQCRPVYAEDDWWKMYNVYLTIIHYFVPMIILDSAYTMIAIKIWSTTVGGSSIDNRQQNVSSEMSNRKLMKMLMIVVACFSLCWFPLETYLLLNEIKPEINGWKYINVLFFCSHWLAMSNSCLNPIIYGLYNNKYKKEYKRVFGRLICRKYDDHHSIEEHQKTIEAEFAANVVQRSWLNPYASEGVVPYYTETFQVVPLEDAGEKKNGDNCQLLNNNSSSKCHLNGKKENGDDGRMPLADDDEEDEHGDQRVLSMMAVSL
ncbi:unnamed protein product [Auanema sp. JU1783]|nr:unnamed protein product [Auanema sp. JU1783]